MKPVFADTFYWIALTNPQDGHSETALLFDDLLSGGHVTTTEEVLTEFLAFLAGDRWLRDRAVETVREILSDETVRVVPQSHESFLSGSIFTPHVPTRDTASQIASQCKPCVEKG